MRIPIGLFLIIFTFMTYSQVLEYEFLNIDDNQYVTENTHITKGFNYKFVIWAFTQSYASNWHPLTWLSHMLDFEIYGLDDDNKIPTMKEGSIIVFPSFINHRVAPVTKGTRYSLVAWFVGPPFV